MERYWEVDAGRGIALALMIVFHFIFDLNFLGILKIEPYEGLPLLLQRATISLFLLLVGVSLHISRERMNDKRTAAVAEKFAKRSLFLFAVAALITTATYAFLGGKGFVVFGIIHFIALCVLLTPIFLEFKVLNAVAGAGMLASSLFFQLPQAGTPLLLWLGFTPPGFSSVDYVPLYPWLGLVLLGVFAGKTLYPKGRRAFKIRARQPEGTGLLSWMGRNSLSIYLAHQPMLFGALLAAKSVL